MRSRNSLLIALLATTIVLTGVLSWAGWRLLRQQRDIDRQRAGEAIDAAAAAMAADIRGRLAEAREHLSAAHADPADAVRPAAGVLLTLRADGSMTAAGEPGLAFVPANSYETVEAAVFATGRMLEMARSDLAGAAVAYTALTTHADSSIRAGALLRLGRVHVKAGDGAAALEAYRQLAAFGGIRVEGLPTAFVGLYGQRTAARLLGREALHRQLTSQLREGLTGGAWPLTRGQVEHYLEEFAAPISPGSWALADAVDRVWSEFGGTLPARGLRVHGEQPRSVLVMWRSSDVAAAVLAAHLDDFLPAAPEGIAWRLSDAENRRLAGHDALGAGTVRERLIGDAEYPWTLSLSTTGTAAVSAHEGERTLVGMLAAVLLFLWGAMYVMARAIRREAAVARLQSEFVAAVSHEFRSPLTTIRQMSEMLDMGRVASEERRRAYYRVLATEAARLQRLVETLLNFGRMEAGATAYNRAPVDLAAVVRRVVAEIEPAAREAGKRIDVSGTDDATVVHADEHALALAVRNLIDNAVKYSPDEAPVAVQWGRDGEHARVRVIDRGVGIPRHEQHVVFDRFVRGRSAVEGNVPGTGLGLSMVRQIANAHGGDIQLDSDVGRGSTFTLLLPLIKEQRADSVSPVLVRP